MIDGLEQLWKVALSVAGLASVGSFVLWSLYKQWLSLPIFSTLTKPQQYKLLRLFLILTFLFAVLALAAYLTIQLIAHNSDQKPTESVVVTPIEGKEQLISLFKNELITQNSVQNIDFIFNSPGLGLNFNFKAPHDTYPYQLLTSLIKRFSLKDLVTLNRASFPTGIQNGSWYQDWKLLRNGVEEGKEFFNRDDKTYAQLGAQDGDVLTLKLEWGLSALVSSNGKNSSGETAVKPPELEF